MSWIFIGIPLLSLLCNGFLFLAILNSKKTKPIKAFILLLACFVLWSAGSLLMRLQLAPGYLFWFDVSAAGIFATPYFIYFFFHCYTGRRGSFSLILLGVMWAVVIAMNFLGVFVRNPTVVSTGASPEFTYTLSWLSIIPTALAAFTVAASIRMIYRSIRFDGVSKSTYTPLILGMVIMFVGIVVQSFLDIRGASSDTIFCFINAIFIYYALYKKRLISLTPIASASPVYLMSIAFSTLIGGVIFKWLYEFYNANFEKYIEARSFVFILLFSVLTITVYGILRRLMSMLFVKGHEAREKVLAKLCHDISRSLSMDDTLSVLRDFLESNIDCDAAYILLPNPADKSFRAVLCTQSTRSLDVSLNADNPLVEWLRANGQSIKYRDFCHTRMSRSMWATEKQALQLIGVELALPIACDGELLGITLFTAKNRNRSFTYTELSFLDSASAIVAISFKNASLYMEMEKEARRDSLTGLYNRRYFLRQLDSSFKECLSDKFTLLIFNIDDLRLFNELYGTHEGDEQLVAFAGILERVVAERGMVCRYSGKEFAVSLPHCTATRAQGIAEECRSLFAAHCMKENRILTFSAGICGYPLSASNIDDLMSYTNMAMFSAKRNGKNVTVVYSSVRQNADAYRNDAESKRQIGEGNMSTILALTAAIDAKDHYTFKHSNNVSRYASKLAEAISLDSEHVEIIRQAGVLHDIGKIGIPESILSKTGKLTAEEFETMKTHVEGSISMIRHIPALDYVIPAAIGHHERWDGKGYPRGIAGEAIPVGARCLCLADTFDAMTTKRSYRDAMSVDVALEEIERNLGTQFDPVLGAKFVELVRSGEITVG